MVSFIESSHRKTMQNSSSRRIISVSALRPTKTESFQSIAQLAEYDHQRADTGGHISMRSIMSDSTLLAVENGKYLIFIQ